ncbi:hypothetical protein [Micrococcus sp.]|uniref:hypothetical protein n=1 Tax=Micrococcus sp. TaxID=1271 RepID=UPI002A91AF42|nr:hypothetical protein [Micrococcus sp.]MDY6055823.1 hypothetical protein [Micrococcus sp.]
MTQNISRRSVAKGAAWSVPAVAVAVSSPARAASPSPVLGCSAASVAAIDQAFTNALAAAQAVTTPLFELNFYHPGSQLDGSDQHVYLNVKNISGVEQQIDYTNRLAFTVETRAAATAPNANDTRDGRAVNYITSSWGQFQVNGGQWRPANTYANNTNDTKQPNVRDSSWVQAQDALEQRILWEFYGGSLAASGGAAEMDLDIYFLYGDEWKGGRFYNNPQYIQVTPTVNPAVALAPTLAETGAEAACQAYYDQKLAEFDAATQGTPASRFVINGPISGSQQINVGDTFDSRTTGNFAPSALNGAKNGIF